MLVPVVREQEMNRIPGNNPVIVICALIVAGWCILPVSAVQCDGPPQSQSLILFSGGCDRSPPVLPCTQGFMFPAQTSAKGDFPTQYFLDFGDGSLPYYGTVDGVTHSYRNPGIFTIKFMAGTQCDRWISDTFTLSIPAPPDFIPVTPACSPQQPSAGFIGTPISGVAPHTVQFTSTSTGADAFVWNFSDGGISPAQNPRHTYTVPGIYSVSLEARDSCSGSVSRVSTNNFVTVTPPVTVLSLSSNPPGAVVYIDDVIKGRTPVTLTDTPPGNHRLTLTLEGYEVYTRNIIIEAVSPLTIAAVLTKTVTQPPTQAPRNGSIALTSNPSGAAVYIDGSLRGTSPALFPEIFPGYHQVTLSKTGYDDWSTVVSIGSGQTAAINAVMMKSTGITGSLAVITDPPGAEIFIDGDFEGVSPVTIQGLLPGTHSVLVTLEEYTANSTSLSITAGEIQKYSTELRRIYKPQVTDIVLATGAVVMIAVIALMVMFRKDKKRR